MVYTMWEMKQFYYQCYILLEDKFEVKSVTENHFFNSNSILIDNETGDSYLINGANLEFSLPGLGITDERKFDFNFALDDEPSIEAFKNYFNEAWNDKNRVFCCY